MSDDDVLDGDGGRDLPWADGRWTHPPLTAREEGGHLLVEAAAESDAWRHTAYGFVHDSEHALLAPLPERAAMEVTFDLAYDGLFDQAGIFVRLSDETWVKAGVEFSDGLPQLGAVVTHRVSDWSVAPVPEWAGRAVTLRASRFGDALVVRARVADEPWRLVRLAPFDVAGAVEAGPYVCAPTHDGLVVRFHSWRLTPADAALH
jgi:regulation of enolase protein 1 (concanavalin A-like superfamily)